MVKLEAAAKADLWADQLDDALASGSIAVLFQVLKKFTVKRYLSWANSKICRVRDDNGYPACSVAREKTVFRDHFASQLKGTPTSMQDLIEMDRTVGYIKTLTREQVESCIDTIPSYYILAHTFAHNAVNKAHGESRVPGTILRRFPMFLATLYDPIVAKCYTRLHTPIQWRGGMLDELYKNKGLSSDRANYRDIVLGDPIGKNAASGVRSQMLDMAKRLVGMSQFGSGFNGGETAFAHLYVRMFFEVAGTHQMSAAAVFIDVTTAFARLLRRIAFDDNSVDESWLRQLRATGFNEHDIEFV